MEDAPLSPVPVPTNRACSDNRSSEKMLEVWRPARASSLHDPFEFEVEVHVRRTSHSDEPLITSDRKTSLRRMSGCLDDGDGRNTETDTGDVDSGGEGTTSPRRAFQISLGAERQNLARKKPMMWSNSEEEEAGGEEEEEVDEEEDDDERELQLASPATSPEAPCNAVSYSRAIPRNKHISSTRSCLTRSLPLSEYSPVGRLARINTIGPQHSVSSMLTREIQMQKDASVAISFDANTASTSSSSLSTESSCEESCGATSETDSSNLIDQRLGAFRTRKRRSTNEREMELKRFAFLSSTKLDGFVVGSDVLKGSQSHATDDKEAELQQSPLASPNLIRSSVFPSVSSSSPATSPQHERKERSETTCVVADVVSQETSPRESSESGSYRFSKRFWSDSSVRRERGRQRQGGREEVVSNGTTSTSPVAIPSCSVSSLPCSPSSAIASKRTSISKAVTSKISRKKDTASRKKIMKRVVCAYGALQQQRQEPETKAQSKDSKHTSPSTSPKAANCCPKSETDFFDASEMKVMLRILVEEHEKERERRSRGGEGDGGMAGTASWITPSVMLARILCELAFPVEKWDGLRNNLASPRIFAVLYEMAIKGQLKVFYQIHAGECVLGDSFARGGSSVLYNAVYRDEPVVVKVMSPDNITYDPQEFWKEVTIMTLLEHPSLLPCLGAWQDGDTFYLVLPKFDCNLQQFLEDNIPNVSATLTRRVKIAADIARGVARLHRFGVMHRDLKSANVLIKDIDGERVKCVVADFGSSRRAYGKKSFRRFNRMTGNIGTIFYTAPEAFSSNVSESAEYNSSIDVYSFGMLFYELATGIVPFSNQSKTDLPTEVRDRDFRRLLCDLVGFLISYVFAMALFKQLQVVTSILVILNGKRPSIPDEIPDVVADIFRTCWAASPQDRPDMDSIFTSLNDIYECVVKAELGHSRTAAAVSVYSPRGRSSSHNPPTSTPFASVTESDAEKAKENRVTNNGMPGLEDDKDVVTESSHTSGKNDKETANTSTDSDVSFQCRRHLRRRESALSQRDRQKVAAWVRASVPQDDNSENTKDSDDPTEDHSDAEDAFTMCDGSEA